MYYKTPYWFWTNAVDDKWINKVHKLAKKRKLKKATVGEKLEVKDTIRKSNISFLTEDWIHRKLHSFITKANQKAGWNFEWFKTEEVQYTEYLLNQFYDYHVDCHVIPTPTNRQRKLSITISLNDSSEYEGGEFKLMLSPNEVREIPELKKKGTVVVFPSSTWHKIEPVTKGKRYSLVAWAEGFSFK
jgi:PKHD-type hydroxylase|tara:strand:+ start:623 stop:1183 length:561 start_codon:yes stop_codon:yes gene_type:complete